MDRYMNKSLSKLHHLLFLGYAIGGGLIGGLGFFSPQEDTVQLALFVLAVATPLAAFHFFAASGARQGKAWGKVLSQTFAVLVFLGFPIGTALSIYIFMKTGGGNWEGA